MNGGDLATGLGFTNYDAQVGVNYNAGSPTFSRPIDQCEVIAYAPYFNGGCINDGGGYGGAYPTASATLLQNAADNYASAVPASMDAALRWVDFDTRRGSRTQQTVTIGGDTKTFTVPGAAPANASFVSFYTTGTAFSGIDYTQIYWVINSSGSTFQISTTSSGTAITGISGGSGTQYTGSVTASALQRLQALYFATTNSSSFGWAQIVQWGAASGIFQFGNYLLRGRPSVEGANKCRSNNNWCFWLLGLNYNSARRVQEPSHIRMPDRHRLCK
jgi:hypothetical protein